MLRSGLARLLCAATALKLAECMSELVVGGARGFEPPFEIGDVIGRRGLPGFFVDGDAVVHKNFVRLTSEKPDQHGWLWSKDRLNRNEFVIDVAMRVSGHSQESGSSWFGESIDGWVVLDKQELMNDLAQHAPSSAGLLSFVGEANLDGVGFSYNAYSSDSQTLFVLGGRGTMSGGEIKSCQLPARQHEDRPGFSPSRVFRVRMMLQRGTFTVMTDVLGSGQWSFCNSIKLSSAATFPADWAKEAHLGLSAGTSKQLTNNHDVVSLSIFSSPESEVLGWSDFAASNAKDMAELRAEMSQGSSAGSNSIVSTVSEMVQSEARKNMDTAMSEMGFGAGAKAAGRAFQPTVTREEIDRAFGQVRESLAQV
jgi:hypothetical protein